MELIKVCSVLFLLLLKASGSCGQISPRESFEEAMRITDKDPEDYTGPLVALQHISPDLTDLYGFSTWCQAMMTYHSFIGSYDSVLYYSDQRYQNSIDSLKIPVDTSFVASHRFVDAAAYILTEAEKHTITMINEAHHLPFHRAFTMQMLADFFQKGYRVLAVETLGDTSINEHKIVNYHTGYYSREPLFAEMLRYALKLGFKLSAYECDISCNYSGTDRTYCNTFRDSVMAANIGKIIRDNRSDKILVYAGYDHIHKGNDNGWKKMGEFIRESLEIEPLCIDQTVQVEHFFAQREDEKFLATNNILQIKKPVIAIGTNDSIYRTKFVDISVIHPRYATKEGRPAFYQINGLRKAYALRELKLSKGQIAQAFYVGEEAGARIPADQLIADGRNDSLYLFPGTYELLIKEPNDKLCKRTFIRVP